MAVMYGSITVKVSEEVFNKKKKALCALNAEGSNFSKKMSDIIEEYAAKYDELGLEEK
jgi:hypothetical protein